MQIHEFYKRLEGFQRELEEHQRLWGASLDRVIPDYPIKNTEELGKQSRSLSRRLGALRPYIEQFDRDWLMGQQASGQVWDALNSAVGLTDVASVKATSLRGVIQKLDQILGRLETLDQYKEILGNPNDAAINGVNAENAIASYLDCLHPFIANGCAQLYRDRHYSQSVAEASKAVFQYLRNKTGLTGDGGSLAQQAFSIGKPKLAFSDLADQTKKDEQVGFMEMLAGFGKGVRNPLAHTHGKQEDPQKAFEYLVLASLFCRRIDEATLQI